MHAGGFPLVDDDVAVTLDAVDVDEAYLMWVSKVFFLLSMVAGRRRRRLPTIFSFLLECCGERVKLYALITL